jgi:hypothetical protein
MNFDGIASRTPLRPYAFVEPWYTLPLSDLNTHSTFILLFTSSPTLPRNHIPSKSHTDVIPLRPFSSFQPRKTKSQHLTSKWESVSPIHEAAPSNLPPQMQNKTKARYFSAYPPRNHTEYSANGTRVPFPSPRHPSNGSSTPHHPSKPLQPTPLQAKAKRRRRRRRKTQHLPPPLPPPPQPSYTPRTHKKT